LQVRTGGIGKARVYLEIGRETARHSFPTSRKMPTDPIIIIVNGLWNFFWF